MVVAVLSGIGVAARASRLCVRCRVMLVSAEAAVVAVVRVLVLGRVVLGMGVVMIFVAWPHTTSLQHVHSTAPRPSTQHHTGRAAWDDCAHRHGVGRAGS